MRGALSPPKKRQRPSGTRGPHTSPLFHEPPMQAAAGGGKWAGEAAPDVSAVALAVQEAGKRRRRRRRQAAGAGSDSDTESCFEGLTVESFRIQDRIGSGSFADCYLGKDQQSGQFVCLKIEDTHRAQVPKLRNEWLYLSLLQGERRRTPDAYALLPWRGDRYTVLVQELLGPSLEDLFQRCGRRLGNATVALVAPQVLDAVEHVHKHGILHRDIKPHNFLVGRKQEAWRIFLIDFGLSTSYLDDKKRHIPFREGRPLVGTSRYVSLAVHQGHEQGRRDDLESVAHMFYYFVWGQLPWQGLPKLKTKPERHRAIFHAKRDTPLSTLCDPHPKALRVFLEYSRGLSFTDEPDYDMLRRSLIEFRQAEAGGERYDLYDWRVKGVHREGMGSGPEHAAAGGPGGNSEGTED